MAEHLVDAALRVPDGGRDAAYFIVSDRYVVWDWADDRCRDGVRALAALRPPEGFLAVPPLAPTPPGASIDTALRGKAGFDGFHYLFSGSRYVRFTTLPAVTFDPASVSDASAWQLPFPRVDASFNGALNRDDFCYFFSGPNYVRYSWSADRPDGDAKPIANMIGVPPAFAGGFDAGVDGGGSFADASYMFREDRYVRFDWVADAAEPHANPDQSVQGNWVGLAEMLAAAKATSIALTWLDSAHVQAAAYQDALDGAGFPQPIVAAALATHFHAGPLDTATLAAVVANLAAIQATLANEQAIRYRTDPEAVADGAVAIDAAYTWPFPVTPATRINVTGNFLGRSEDNRVLSLIHEAWHANDDLSASATTHIPEWYVTASAAAFFGMAFQPDNDAFSTRYDLMNTSDALHNPAAYAAFARHLAFGVDSRALP